MRSMNFTFQEIKFNFIKNKRMMFFIFLISLIAGICVGIYSGLYYKQPVYELDDTVVDNVNLDFVEKDEDYYYSAVCELREKKLSLESYVQYLGQVDMSAESTMKIDAFQEKLLQFGDDYKRIWNTWWSSGSIGYGTKEEIEKFFEKQIEECDEKIDAVNQMIEEAQDNSFTRSFIATTEKNALDNIISIKNTKKTWEKKQNIVLDSDEEKIASDNNQMDSLLEEGFDKLNHLVEEFNEIISFLESKEQYDVVYNKYLMKSYVESVEINEEIPIEKVMANSKNNAIIYARSVAGLDNNQERFYAIVTFFALFGIAVSLLYGAFYTKGKKEV